MSMAPRPSSPDPATLNEYRRPNGQFGNQPLSPTGVIPPTPPRNADGTFAQDEFIPEFDSQSEGSFRFPPFFSNAADAFQFWMTTPVDDGDLEMMHSYFWNERPKWNDREARNKSVERMDDWDEEHPFIGNTDPSGEVRRRQARSAVQNEYYRQELEKANRKYPVNIPWSMIRPLARIARSLTASDSLDEHELEALEQRKVKIGNETHTMLEWNEMYRLDEAARWL